MNLHIPILVLAIALAGLAWLIRVRQRNRDPGADITPTIAGEPATARPLNGMERRAYHILSEALPRGYLLLPQVALARFIKVSQRTSYRAWYDRIGHRCVDFLVCNGEGEVVTVVELDEHGSPDTGYQQVVARKARVLEAAGVPVMYWFGSDLPTVALARHRLELAATGGGLRARQVAAQPSDLAPLAERRATRSAPLSSENEEFRKRWRPVPADAARRHIGDTYTFEEEGIVLSPIEQDALERLLRSPV